MMFASVKNKTVFCLLIITLFTSFFFARSVVVRERWIAPTFMHIPTWLEHKQHITAMNLAYVNNWLKESPSQLRLGKYMYPASVETPTLDKRNFHPSYPPGVVAQLYVLFKLLDVTGLVPNIYEQRETQLLLVILYNFMLHFLLALVMCWLAFFICCKLGFDRLNSTLLGIVPAIVLFHNAGNLYWFHLVYSAPTAIVPLFALYIFLELLRTESISPRILRAVQVMQPIIMFIGVFTSWLFAFVILTVYITRVVRKEIALPASLQNSFQWVKQSLIFFLPSLAAIVIWIYTLLHYQRHIIQANILEAPVSSFGYTFTDNLLRKIGILDAYGQPSSITDYVVYFTKALYTHISHDYGIVAVLMLYAVFYMTTRGRKFMTDSNNSNLAAVTYLLFFIPCLLHTLFLVVDDADHHFVALRYSPALSLSFIFAPIFILPMLKKSHLAVAMQFANSRQITVVALVGVSSAGLWAYTQINNKQPITKMFTPPAYHHIAVGEFVKKNTDYSDVVFSQDYYLADRPFLIQAHFTNKIMHFASNLDHIYHKVKSIEEDDFTIKVFYYEKHQKEIARLITFLKSHNITLGDQREEKVGGLLAFNGKKFCTWYEKTHTCDEFPQRCNRE